MSQPDPAGAHLLTRAQIARRYGGKGVTVSAMLMTYGAARGFTSGLANASRGIVDPSRKVWVVTDYYDPPRRVLPAVSMGRPLINSRKPAALMFLHDSIVVDAATGTETDACRGCAVVPESNTTSWPAAAKPTVSKAQWVADLRRAFKAKTVRAQLVWQAGIRSVDLEWLAYIPHGTMKPLTPAGLVRPVRAIRPYVRPVGASIGAFGGPPEGASTLRPRHHSQHHRVHPLQSRVIPVAVVRALARKGFRIGLTSYLVSPTISRRRTLETLNPSDPSQVAQHIWLVYLFGTKKTQLAWLIERRDGPYEFVSATSGRVIASAVNP